MLRGLQARRSIPSRAKLPLRTVSTLPHVPSVLTIASITLGLPLALWTYKCMMMVLFQRRIIYMGYAPLGARNQYLDDLPRSALEGIQCREINLQGRDGANLSGILVHRDDTTEENIEVVLVYFQGKFQRIPIFQHLCKSTPPQRYPRIAVLAMAPRSYWKSTPRWPTQSGIIKDYSDILQYALHKFPAAQVVLYGHSLGGAAAICTLAELQQPHADRQSIPSFDRIGGLILENPFASIPAMVRALYPQKWLPYQYLAPLAFDKWDTLATLELHAGQDTLLGRVSRNMLLLLSEHDEMVPREMGARIFHLATQNCSSGGALMIEIPKALHENAWTKKAWTDEMRKYLTRFI
ncbi:hypothetical protein D9756_005304 [Leucocoprinus leucothites]|uniref:AB hydrolase-1 domain-containing protein n=1 Tax=Leucocoprinus leucothites TaxID=201217 RepID=A0A8H5D793_9AGAR|nr:hypothetical protein D9756_005304 [Leucoagaricus leucothites]